MRLTNTAERYIAEAGRLRTPISERKFTDAIGNLSRYVSDDIDAVTPENLTAWCLHGTDPAPNTVRTRRTMVTTFFAWCAWKGIIDEDPAKDLKFSVVPGKGTRTVHTWLDKAQVVEVLSKMPQSPLGDRDRLIVMFGTLCGLRASEMTAVRWHDIDPDCSQFTLAGKGGKVATIGVPEELQAALLTWKTRVPDGVDVVLPRIDNQLGVGGFRAETIDWGTPLKYKGVLGAAHRAGLNPHDLRRSFAGILEDEGVPVTDISRAMRHSNVATTSLYLDKNPQRTAEVTKGLRLGI